MELASEQDTPRSGLQGSETGKLEVNRMLTKKIICDGDDTEKMLVDSTDNISLREVSCHDDVTCDNGRVLVSDKLDTSCDTDAAQNCVSSQCTVPTNSDLLVSRIPDSDGNTQNAQLCSDSLNTSSVNEQLESVCAESKTENRPDTSIENGSISAKTADQCSDSPRELHLNAKGPNCSESASDKCDEAMHRVQHGSNECTRNSELLSALLKPEPTLAKSDSLKTVVNTMVEVGMWMPLSESNDKPINVKTQDSNNDKTQLANNDSIQKETKELRHLLSDGEDGSVICTSAGTASPCTSGSPLPCTAGITSLTSSQSDHNVNKASNLESTDTRDVTKRSSGEGERPSSSSVVKDTSKPAASSSVDMSEQTRTTSTLSKGTVACPNLANVDAIFTTVIRGRDRSSPIVVWTTEEDMSVQGRGIKRKGDTNVILGTDSSNDAKNQSNEDGVGTEENVMSSIKNGAGDCENSSLVASSAAAAGKHSEKSAADPGICHDDDNPEENEHSTDSAVDPVVIAPVDPDWCDDEQTATTSSLPQICQVFGGMTGSKLQQLHTQGSISTNAEKGNEGKQQHSLLKSILRSANKASRSPGTRPKKTISSQEGDPSEVVTPEKTRDKSPGTITIKEEKLDAGYPDEPPVTNPEEQLVRYVGYKNILPAPCVDGKPLIQSTTSQDKQPGKTVVSTAQSKTLTSQQGNLTSLLQNQAVSAKTMLLSRGMLTNVSGVVGKVVRNGTGNLQVAVPLLVSKAGSQVVGQPPVLFTFASLPKSSSTDSSIGVSVASTVQPVVTNIMTPLPATPMPAVSNKSKLPTTPKQAASSELDSDYSRYLRHVIKFKTEIKSLKDTDVKYTCPMPPSSLFLSHKMNRMYVCRGCDSTFHKQSTLSEHQLRRSMTLRYSCDTNCHVLFYNVCQLILHTRNHPPKRPDWQERVVIYGLSEDLMSSAGPETYADVKKSIYKAAGVLSTKLLQGKDKAAESTGTEKKKQLQRIVKQDADLSNKTEPADHCYGGSDKKTLNQNGKSSSKTSPVKGSICTEQRVNTMLDGKPVLCTECGLMFKNSSDLMMHMINYGSNDTLCLCKTCPVILRSKCAQSAHARIHKNSVPYVCPECGQVIHGSHNVFWKHLHVKCVHHIRQALFECSFCRKQFRDQKRLILHTTNQHSTKFYKCQLCPMAFKVAAGVTQHAKANHGGKVLQKIIYKCPFCVAVYRDDTYGSHIEQHLSSAEFRVVYKCNACSKSFEKRSLCIKHMTQVHKFYFNHNHMCHICGTDFRLSSTLLQHQLDEHPNIPELDNALTRCLKHSGVISSNDESASLGSPASAKSPQDSMRQQSSDRPLTVLDIKEEPTDDEGRVDDENGYHCGRCQMTMASAELYRKHMAKHRFLEKKCLHGKGVGAKSGGLKRSTDNSNDLVLKIKLPKLTGNLTKEQKTVFTKQVPGAPDPEPTYYCSECNCAFYAEDGLAAHLKKEHNQNRQFPCHLCGKTYTDQSALRFHVKKLHEGWSKEKPYVCWICQEKDVRRCFPKRQLLIRHISKEHKIARNMIDYSKMPNLDKDHAKLDASSGQTSPSTIDGEQDTASDKQSEVDVPPVKRLKLEGESSFSCAKCLFVTEDRTSFVAHIKRHQPSKLTDAKLCLECGLSFTVTQSLKRHLLLVHQIRNFNKYMEESGLDLVSQPEEQEVIMPKTTANPQPDKISRPRSFMDSKQYVYKRNQKDEEQNDLECKVCYRAYDDELELRAHMRTHGMAYIRSSRRLDDA